ncbi:unnamed protein product [Adineta ricciae]|uniref:G-protein coupled receptors family 1 profile domain-containing protein n=1 Tax=Adineta ricciae TaxID=249248 RepID=A0A814Y7E6_ADIRI|nr:unnamed protein product [Adineta ricciae]CAF1225918.1 unnamed protein product [Adineta ricciae]
MDTLTYLLRVILTIEIVIGAFGNTINVLIFTRKKLRHNSCTQYFLAGSINNLLVVSFLFIYVLVTNGYEIPLFAHSSIFCKINCYLSYLIYNLSPYLLVLASFDRFCCSSSLVVLRSLADVHKARRYLWAMLVIFIIIFTPLPFFYDISSTDPPQCVSTNQKFNTIWSIFQLIFYALLPPVLMTIFGLLTLWNIRFQRQHIQPMIRSRQLHRRKDQQLRRRSDNAVLRMLIFQICAYILCVTMLCVMVVMINTVSYPTPLMVTFVRIAMLPFYLSHCTSFYIYTLSAKLYRKEFLAVVRKVVQRIQKVLRYIGSSCTS